MKPEYLSSTDKQHIAIVIEMKSLSRTLQNRTGRRLRDRVKTEWATAGRVRKREKPGGEDAMERKGQKITDEGAYYRSAEFTSDAISFPFYCSSFSLASYPFPGVLLV